MQKKISEMNKAELYDFMKASREIHRFDYDLPSWKRAAQLYRETGNKFDEDCTGCRSRLLEWLTQ